MAAVPASLYNYTRTYEMLHFYAKADLMPYGGTKTAKTLAAQAKSPKSHTFLQSHKIVTLWAFAERVAKVDELQ